MTTNGAADPVMSSPPAAAIVCISETASPQTVLIKGKRFRQRPLGPAPFASFEDSSDELDSPPESARVPGLPGIKEDPASQLATPVSPCPLAMTTTLNLTQQEELGLKEALAGQLDTPAPPRIDISRASSSSQHEDSITSSPDHDGPHNLGYKEDGALDLRSSTEELDYTQEPGTIEETEAKRKRERMMKKQHQHDFGDTQSEHDIKERKDSNCSVVSDFGGHLYIGGRTSRLSSVGSAASGGSAASAMSHLSGTSHLSAGSRLSRGSRSPSPHKMLLETSFCGGKPMPPAQSIDVESAPNLVTHVEKPSSRPPSRLRSRSPSPHKMLLETSFCGTKQLASNKEKDDVKQPPVRRRSSNTLTPDMVTAVEIVAQPTPPPPTEKIAKSAAKKEVKEAKEIVPVEKSKPVVKKEKKMTEFDEIRRADDVPDVPPPRTVQRKPLNLAKMMERKIQAESKPKKVISIRDIPGDEIFIPLTGPEIDFDAIIRKASPKLSRKEPSQDTPDVIYIPLHSPPKEKETVVESYIPTQQYSSNEPCEDGSIYIPLHSPPQSKKIETTASTSQSAGTDGKASSGKTPKAYEVCEDGSIYIPLHTPEEEKSSRTFEEEIKRVEKELQRVRAAEAQRKEREREQQNQKPVTLDLAESSAGRSMLSQSCPSGRQELLSGSRTPSPGSSLSRKSSFASIFRRSELSASPDSPSGSGRKKSGTFSNILKDATDGLRERSRSRSKSKERSTCQGVSRSPSFKKNVFGGLFTKKKDEGRLSDASDIDVPTMDLQFKFDAPQPTFQGEDRGDYIFIPLRDPNDPPEQEEVPQEVIAEKPPSPIKIEEIKDSPKAWRKSRDLEESVVRTDVAAAPVVQLSTVMSAYRSPVEESLNLVSKPEEISQPPPIVQDPQAQVLTTPEFVPEPRTHFESVAPESQIIQGLPPEVPESKMEDEQEVAPDVSTTLHARSLDSTIQDSSLELDDDGPREELVTVATDGVRKLKLPPEPGDLDEDHERKGLVVQDSFEEELPYVPTTLPLERAVGVTLVPAKERVNEVKTCPIDRPRSTTPINPASLEDYMTRRESVRVADRDKMKICLPREESVSGRAKSPRRFSGKGKTWFEFAEAGLPNPRDLRKNSLTASPSPPPLPPRADGPPTSPQKDFTASATPPAATWINFEELPEKRKLPKKITTLPAHRGSTDGGAPEKPTAPVVFSYVNPEDCQCECHDHKTSGHAHGKSKLVAGSKWNSTRIVSEFSVESECEDCACEQRDLEEEPLLQEQCGEGDEQVDVEDDALLDDEADEEPLLGGHEAEEESVVSSRPQAGHIVRDAELEERPLLDGNSDDESVSRNEMEWNIRVTRLEVELPPLSDSSYEAVSLGGHSPTENVAELIPFAMDLDIHSNRSSMASQNDEPSPDKCDKSLPR